MNLKYSNTNKRYYFSKKESLSVSDKYKLIMIIFTAISMILLVATTTNAQSIMIDNQDRIMIQFSEEEKAIKASSSCIIAKKTIEWETNINKIPIKWKVDYKDTKIYTLYRNGIKYYESTNITGIRSKYASDLLGRDIKIQ